MKTIDELQAEIAGLKAILQDKDKEIKTLEKVKRKWQRDWDFRKSKKRKERTDC